MPLIPQVQPNDWFQVNKNFAKINQRLDETAAVTHATLDATGAVTVGGTLDVTGNTTLSANLSVGGDADVTGNLSIDGALELTGLDIGGVCYINGDNELTTDATNFYWDYTNNRLGLGTNSPSYPFHLYSEVLSPNPCFYVYGQKRLMEYSGQEASNNWLSCEYHCYRLNSDGSANFNNFVFAAGRETNVSPAISKDDDRILNFVMRGHNGSDFKDAAAIKAFVDDTPTSTSMPGRLEFGTTRSGNTPAKTYTLITSKKKICTSCIT